MQAYSWLAKGVMQTVIRDTRIVVVCPADPVGPCRWPAVGAKGVAQVREGDLGQMGAVNVGHKVDMHSLLQRTERR